ncbi:MAG: hypothetical protein WDN26_02485 [Chitinophagaceae bacterium]
MYELLGGPTRKEVEVYGSCLGFSVEKGKVGPKAKTIIRPGLQTTEMVYGIRTR